jgi:hypothetical protein
MGNVRAFARLTHLSDPTPKHQGANPLFTVPQGKTPYGQEHVIASETPRVKANAPLLNRTLAMARVDWTPSHLQPKFLRVVIATVIALTGALVADALIVALGTALFPGTAANEHFAFADYAKLTVIGVLFGCAGWPVVTRCSSAPRWLYGRLVVLATLVLFLPDAWLLLRGQALDAVAVLMVMHVAVALVIYGAVVTIAPVREHSRTAR